MLAVCTAVLVPAGGGTLPYSGSHRIRHAMATPLVNNGMPLED